MLVLLLSCRITSAHRMIFAGDGFCIFLPLHVRIDQGIGTGGFRVDSRPAVRILTGNVSQNAPGRTASALRAVFGPKQTLLGAHWEHDSGDPFAASASPYRSSPARREAADGKRSGRPVPRLATDNQCPSPRPLGGGPGRMTL